MELIGLRKKLTPFGMNCPPTVQSLAASLKDIGAGGRILSASFMNALHFLNFGICSSFQTNYARDKKTPTHMISV